MKDRGNSEFPDVSSVRRPANSIPAEVVGTKLAIGISSLDGPELPVAIIQIALHGLAITAPLLVNSDPSGPSRNKETSELGKVAFPEFLFEKIPITKVFHERLNEAMGSLEQA